MSPLRPRTQREAGEIMHSPWGQGSLQASKDSQTDPDASQDPHSGGEEERSGLRGPCKECHQTYIGETKRTLKVRLGEHKQAVKRGDPKNGIAVHAHESNHMIDWDGVRVKRSGMTGYWQRKTTEAIHIKLSGKTMNLDGGLQLSTV